MSSNEEQLQYVEEVALFFEQLSVLPRTAGRIFGWLLICQPPQQTMNDLVNALQVSKSSVSTATRILIQVGLAERISLPGERRDYYRLTADVWNKSIENRMIQVTALRELAGRGLSLLAETPSARRHRLQEMHDLYAFFEQEMPLLLARWRAAKPQKEDDSTSS